MTNQDIAGLLSIMDAKDEENAKGMNSVDHMSAAPYRIHTALLPSSH
jgi:hypothetical protein